MPITPQFSLSQTDSHLVVDIRVPHVRVSADSLQVVVEEGSILHFASHPYLLVLRFHEEFAEAADEDCATYSPDNNGTVQLKLRKKDVGVEWGNLDLVGKLVQKRKKTTNVPSTANWLHQVIEEETVSTSLSDSNSRDNKIPMKNDEGSTGQSPRDGEDNEEKALSRNTGYGFARMFSGIFRELNQDGMAHEMLSMVWDERRMMADSDAAELYRSERRTDRCKRQMDHFSQERYLGDLDVEDDYLYQCARQMRPHWKVQEQKQKVSKTKDGNSATTDSIVQLAERVSELKVGEDMEVIHDFTDKSTDSSSNVDSKQSTTPPSQVGFFTSGENVQLSSIPYPLIPSTQATNDSVLVANLLDILFAYTYDHLLTDGDPTVESAWTISILSTSLSWLEEHETIQETVMASLQRSLIYPYLRNFDLAVWVWKNVQCILNSGGVRSVIRCMLQTRQILEKSELYYLSNKLFIDPYLAWLQRSTATTSGSIDEVLCRASQQLDAILDDKALLKRGLFMHLDALEGTIAVASDCNDSSVDTGSDSDESEYESDASSGSSCSKDSGKSSSSASVTPKFSAALLDDNLGNITTQSRLVSLNGQQQRNPISSCSKISNLIQPLER